MIGGLFVMALFEAGLMLLPEPVYEIDRAIGWEWIPGNFAEDEYVEVTPQSIRLRKKILEANQRPRKYRNKHQP